MKKNFLNGRIVERYKIWFLIPLCILLVSAFVFLGFGISSTVNASNAGAKPGEAVLGGINDGFNIGIDFEGGTMLTIKMPGTAEEFDKNYNSNVNELKSIIVNNGGKISYVQKSTNGEIILKCDAFDEKQENTIKDAIVAKFTDIDRDSDIASTTITATASKDLVLTAVISIIVSTILILIYVIIRFEFWSAISAVIALTHDVLMMLALTVIFRVQINSSFIAAIITIVSYSINATIVLFDRVRENYKIVKPGSDLKEYNRAMCNKSIKETFTRNINTTVTTLVAITVLAIIGAASIREFALPVIFGLVVGCYSSMVISPSIFCLLKNRFSKATRPQKTKKVKKAKEVKELA